MAAIEEVEELAAATVRSLMRDGGASIVVGFMVGFMAEFGIRFDVGRRYSHIIMCGLQSTLRAPGGFAK